MLSSPMVVKIRSMTRKIGLNKLIGSMLIGSRYEDKFGPAFKACIRTGDTVWDVGANVGLYTAVFLEATGQTGRVVAFEPTAACFDQLRGRFADPAHVTLKNMALGDSDGTISMAVDADPLAATHHIVSGNSSGVGVVAVDVRAANSIVKEAPDLFPNAVKIDVEGHEGSVLDGFGPLLADKRLHSIGLKCILACWLRVGKVPAPSRWSSPYCGVDLMFVGLIPLTCWPRAKACCEAR